MVLRGSRAVLFSHSLYHVAGDAGGDIRGVLRTGSHTGGVGKGDLRQPHGQVSWGGDWWVDEFFCGVCVICKGIVFTHVD